MLQKYKHIALTCGTFQRLTPLIHADKPMWKKSRNSHYVKNVVGVSMMICNNGMMMLFLQQREKKCV